MDVTSWQESGRKHFVTGFLPGPDKKSGLRGCSEPLCMFSFRSPGFHFSQGSCGKRETYFCGCSRFVPGL